MEELRFRAFGFPVTVQPAFAVLCGVYLLFGLQGGRPMWTIASWCLVVFGSILLHELGHAAAARRLGLRVRGIFIHGLGGHVTHSGGPARQQLLVSLAGPAAGLALGLPVLAVGWFAELPDAARVIAWQLIQVNVFWSLVNLLPMLPLDGGQAAAAGLELALGRARGWSIATSLGVLTGTLFALLGLWLDEVFLMILGGYCAYTSYQTRMALQAA